MKKKSISPNPIQPVERGQVGQLSSELDTLTANVANGSSIMPSMSVPYTPMIYRFWT